MDGTMGTSDLAVLHLAAKENVSCLYKSIQPEISRQLSIKLADSPTLKMTPLGGLLDGVDVKVVFGRDEHPCYPKGTAFDPTNWGK